MCIQMSRCVHPASRAPGRRYSIHNSDGVEASLSPSVCPQVAQRFLSYLTYRCSAARVRDSRNPSGHGSALSVPKLREHEARRLRRLIRRGASEARGQTGRTELRREVRQRSTNEGGGEFRFRTRLLTACHVRREMMPAQHSIGQAVIQHDTMPLTGEAHPDLGE